jgi:hypothetical protein
MGVPNIGATEMIDEWNERITCPKCHQTGQASLSQRKNDDVPSVQSLHEGFKVVDTQFGPTFYCDGCDVEVLP